VYIGSICMMTDQSTSLSVYLLRSDRVASFEAALSVGTAAQPLAPPLDGYAIGLPSTPRTPEWVPVIQSALQNPVGFSMVGQSVAAFLVVRQGRKTFVMTFGYAWAKLRHQLAKREAKAWGLEYLFGFAREACAETAIFLRDAGW
jgi:uncharacterized protein (TIGR04141 family)